MGYIIRRTIMTYLFNIMYTVEYRGGLSSIWNKQKYQSIDRSIDRSINQSINQSILKIILVFILVHVIENFSILVFILFSLTKITLG